MCNNLYFFGITEQGVPEPSIEWRFPPKELPKNELQVVAMINEFCFPDSSTFPKVKISNKNKKFTFVVTSIDGIKRFGYCKRHLTGEINLANKGRRFAMCYCILSLSPNHAIFDGILEATEGLSKDSLTVMLYKLQRAKLPSPGGKLEITIPALDQPEKTFRFNRPLDDQTLSGFASYDVLLNHLDPLSIVSIVIAMLCERRIIFVSSKLSTLSSCVQASVALLYPFVWQHVFIPVLPVRMITFVCAPVPFVVGLLSLHLDNLAEQADGMEEVIMVDLDHGNVVPPATDYKLLPEDYLSPFIYSIQAAKKLLDESVKKFNLRNIINRSLAKTHQSSECEEPETIQKILQDGLSAFIRKTVGHFGSFVRREGFDKSEFIKYKPELVDFLTTIAGSQLFEQFVNDQNNDRFSEDHQKDHEVVEKCQRASIYNPLKTEIYLREGYLEKYGKGFRGNIVSDVGTFQTRFFKLTMNTLSYYRNNKPDTDPSGVIFLNDLELVQLIEFQGHPECLELKTNDRSYYMYSNNSPNIHCWYDTILWRVGELEKALGKKEKTIEHKQSTKGRNSLLNIFSSFKDSIAKVRRGNEKPSENMTGKQEEVDKASIPVSSTTGSSLSSQEDEYVISTGSSGDKNRMGSVPVIKPKFVNRRTIEFMPLFKPSAEDKDSFHAQVRSPSADNINTRSSKPDSIKMRKHSRLSRITPLPTTLQQDLSNNNESEDLDTEELVSAPRKKDRLLVSKSEGCWAKASIPSNVNRPTGQWEKAYVPDQTHKPRMMMSRDGSRSLTYPTEKYD